MSKLIKPYRLELGDKVAAISLSKGLANAIPHRYEAGKKQFEKEFNLHLIPTKHAMKNDEWLKKNPKARADDLMEAFSDSSIKAIISMTGGEESIRLLPYIDKNIILANPKIFMGFSDATITHFICNKAGVSSFYGPSILGKFAENSGMFPYMVNNLRKVLFSNEIIGEVEESNKWTDEFRDWYNPENQSIKRLLREDLKNEVLQGTGAVQGYLIGGCVQSLVMLNGTEIWPDAEAWNESIVFLDISGSDLSQNMFKYILRNMGAQGIWNKAKGVLFARPGGHRPDESFYEYEKILKEIIGVEYGREDMPIMTRMDFGHTDPVFTLPYGAKTEINCINKKISILEPGVQ